MCAVTVPSRTWGLYSLVSLSILPSITPPARSSAPSHAVRWACSPSWLCHTFPAAVHSRPPCFRFRTGSQPLPRFPSLPPLHLQKRTFPFHPISKERGFLLFFPNSSYSNLIPSPSSDLRPVSIIHLFSCL